MSPIRIIQDYCDLHGLREQEQPVARLEAQANDNVIYACLSCLKAAVVLLEQQGERPPTSEEMDAAGEVK